MSSASKSACRTVPQCCGKKKPAPQAVCGVPTDPCKSNSVNPCASATKDAHHGAAAEAVEHFENMVDNCLKYAKKAKKAGRKIVGIFCEYTPREIIMAADAVPVCMCGGSEETISAAEEDLPACLCPLIKSSYGYSKLKWNPFLEMADLLIAETTCDGKKKMYELLSKRHKMYVLELPQKPDDQDAFRHWHAEVIKLKNFIEKEFKKSITDAKLKTAIKVMNTERALRRDVARTAAHFPPRLSGMHILEAKSLIAGIPEDLEMYRKLVKGAAPSNRPARPRVLITGVPMPHEAEKVMKLVEEAGGDVVAQESCTGLKPIDEDVKETGDPIMAIAEKYFHLPCSVMTANRGRFDLLDRIIREYRPQAVIDLVWQGCLTYDVEARLVQEHIAKKHRLPFLKLVTDYSPSDSAQLKVRIQALLEMVRNR
jgi:benzoyl-CoA reductase/2-hydroxyglutaryl-CoA dehydratase subunit BcrC/BadD/HgdB